MAPARAKQQQKPLHAGHAAHLLVHGVDLLVATGDRHGSGAEVIAQPELRQHEHAQIWELQGEPVDIAQLEISFAEQVDEDHVRQMRGHDHHTADHRAIDQRLDDNHLPGVALFLGVAEKTRHAVNDGKKGCRAGIGCRHDQRQHHVDSEKAPDDAPGGRGPYDIEDGERDAPVELQQLQERADQECKQA